jgi:hypothetical protein
VPAVNPEPLPEDLLVPHPRRLPPGTPGYDKILALHIEAVRSGQALYKDPISGLSVLTAVQLWERGYCCYSGCRHCPWVER